MNVLDFKEAVSVEWNGDCPNENREQDVLYLEKFVVVGSWQEGKYQGALVICMWRRSANKELVFKVEHEPDSVWDTNGVS